jgi:hypothetical protein
VYSTVVGAIGRFLPWVLIFLPTETGDMPWYDPRQPSGPKTRPRIPRLPEPETYPMPEPQPELEPQPQRAPRRPPTDTPFPEPPMTPAQVPKPEERPQDYPDPTGDPWQWPQPGQRPAPRERPYPGTPPIVPGPAPTAPPTATPSGFPDWLLPLLFSLPGAPSPGRVQLPDVREAPEPTPLTAFQPQRVPYETETCQCDKPKKRGKRKCRNPVVSRRKSTRGGRRYITTTRRIECQA